MWYNREQKEADFPKKNLTLELTEHCQSMNPNLINRYIGEFHKHGIKISADDFGTGYSSFSLMKTLDFDCIKIDQSFIRDIIRGICLRNHCLSEIWRVS